jgi:hypothetical protein
MNLYLISCILVISSPLLVICTIILDIAISTYYYHRSKQENQKKILYEVISDA